MVDFLADVIEDCGERRPECEMLVRDTIWLKMGVHCVFGPAHLRAEFQILILDAFNCVIRHINHAYTV